MMLEPVTLHKALIQMADPEPPTPPTSLPNYLADGLPKQDEETLRDARSYIDDLLEQRQRSVDSSHLPTDAEPVDTDQDGKGTVVLETVTCGDETCHCASGEEHGPYLYRYYHDGDSLVSEYIGKPEGNS